MTLASLKARPAYQIYHTLWTAVDWVYPPCCGGCDQSGYRWCPDCQANTRNISGPVCAVCGEETAGAKLCKTCQTTPPAFDQLQSCAYYNGSLKNALHRLKYQRDIALAEVLAQYLIHKLIETGWTVDLITAVPSSRKRIRERGYNQAAMLAFPVVLAHHIPYKSTALTKVREAESQVGLSAEERKENVRNTFNANPAFVNRKKILLIDDIKTTGSTLQACSVALRQSGAREIYALTLARSSYSQELLDKDIIEPVSSEKMEPKIFP